MLFHSHFFFLFFVDVLTRLSFSRTPSSRPVSWTNKKTSHCVVSDVTSYNKCPFVRDVVYFFREVVLSVLGCIKKKKKQSLSIPKATTIYLLTAFVRSTARVCVSLLVRFKWLIFYLVCVLYHVTQSRPHHTNCTHQSSWCMLGYLIGAWMHSFFYYWLGYCTLRYFVRTGWTIFFSCIARLSSVGVRVLILMGISIFSNLISVHFFCSINSGSDVYFFSFASLCYMIPMT